MKHPDRVFSFKELESEDDLVEAMTNHHWPICYGFITVIISIWAMETVRAIPNMP